MMFVLAFLAGAALIFGLVAWRLFGKNGVLSGDSKK